LTLDGAPIDDGALALVNDQREHTVEVLFSSSDVTPSALHQASP
jgi:hypothetical protein